MALPQRSCGLRTPDQGSIAPSTRRLTLGHVRAVFRLLWQVRDAGWSPLAWRRHMLAGLLRLVDAGTGVATEVVLPRRPGNPRLLGTVIAGVSDRRLIAIYRSVLERGGFGLDMCPAGPGGRASATFTRTRRQLAEQRAWRQRPDLDPWRALDCEYFLCSSQALPAAGGAHLIVLTRPARRRPFDELDRRIVALFHAELGRLWRSSDTGADAALAPQLQRTLELLLDGSSEGEVVARLGLSPHTVHDHVKRLYRHFRVNSRAQLLARLRCSLQVGAPRLCLGLLTGEDDQRFDVVEIVDAGSGRETLTTRPAAPAARAARG